MHITIGALGATTPTSWSRSSEDHRPTADYVRALRSDLPREFPGHDFYFLPADIVTQILNFGIPAPIDVQIEGNDVEANRAARRPDAAASSARSPASSTCASSSRSTTPRSTSP